MRFQPKMPSLKRLSGANAENRKVKSEYLKREEVEIERPRLSRCNSEELAESTLSHLRSRVPRVSKPPPKRSPLSSTSFNGFDHSVSAPIPPPPPPPDPASIKPAAAPPPPPPPPKGTTAFPEKMRRVLDSGVLSLANVERLVKGVRRRSAGGVTGYHQ